MSVFLLAVFCQDSLPMTGLPSGEAYGRTKSLVSKRDWWRKASVRNSGYAGIIFEYRNDWKIRVNLVAHTVAARAVIRHREV